MRVEECQTTTSRKYEGKRLQDPSLHRVRRDVVRPKIPSEHLWDISNLDRTRRVTNARPFTTIVTSHFSF